MSFVLIKGEFRIDAGMPDGDSVRFMANDDTLFDQLTGPRVEFKADGTVQLRYEGIDAIEKAAIQPLAGDTRDTNFNLLRENDDAFTDTPAGYILSKQCDRNRRPVCFAFSGTSTANDGETIFLDGPLVSESVNAKMVAQGMAYTMFYETLYMELRTVLASNYQTAKAAALGIHATDASTSGVTLTSRADLATIPPIFPKLWRRLEEYWRNHTNMNDFVSWLASRGSEKVNTLSDGRTHVSFDNLIEVTGSQVRLKYEADDMVFRPS